MATDGIDIDFREVERLVVNIGRASSAAITAAHGVINDSALKIKTETRENISDNPRWKRLERTVNYEQVGLSAVVGYDGNHRQGELAPIYEFGTAHTAPHPTLYPAAGRELPRFEKAMAVVTGKAIEDVL